MVELFKKFSILIIYLCYELWNAYTGTGYLQSA